MIDRKDIQQTLLIIMMYMYKNAYYTGFFDTLDVMTNIDLYYNNARGGVLDRVSMIDRYYNDACVTCI